MIHAIAKNKKRREKLLSDSYSGLLIESGLRVPANVDYLHSLGTNSNVTITAYDLQPAWVPSSLSGTQKNLRKRVAATAFLASGSDPAINRKAASYYNYDISGNVARLVQENADLTSLEAQHITNGNGLKTIDYQYDLVSGKVNKVLYQDGKWDQFYQQYLYDGENRLYKALSSRTNFSDPNQWKTEALYRYYLHGPLARVELGHNKVQGLDYAYTLQGWLKGVNANFLEADKDMGGDGKAGTAFQGVGRDAFGYSLGYYSRTYLDYKPIGGATASAFGLQYQPPFPDPGGNPRNFESGRDLFNGNISQATYAITQLDAGQTVGYSYRYDQLNRLVGMDSHGLIGAGSSSWNNTSITANYKETVSYDANGNILTYTRNGTDKPGFIQAMDNLSYQYNLDSRGRLINNRLRHITDGVAAGNSPDDIDSQQPDAYHYDAIGNLVEEDPNPDPVKTTITWNVYGKISTVTKEDGTLITYGYDASGNRVSKTVTKTGNSVITNYVRDAQGNVLAVYDGNSSNLIWQEQHLYGSSRLGMAKPALKIVAGQPLANDGYSATNDPLDNGIAGKRLFELTNHLGNVLATVSDVKVPLDPNGGGSPTYNLPEVVTAQDYYPFGMRMPGRSYGMGVGVVAGGAVSGTTTVNGYTVPIDLTVTTRTGTAPTEYVATNTVELLPGFESGATDAFSVYIADGSYAGTGNQGGDISASGGGYRYGFNGQEMSNEIKGVGNSYTAEFWEYDPRVGRRWNVDPMAEVEPGWSPYRAFYDNPIKYIDPDGQLEYESADAFAKANKGKTWDKDRGKGDWLRGDRELNSTTWQKANAFNLQQSDGYKQYTSIEQRAGFYGWYAVQEDLRGGETKWAGAAYLVAKQMTLMDIFYKSGDLPHLYGAKDAKDLNGFANAGNKAIFDDVFGNLKDNLNGAPKKGDAAKSWDAATLHREQFDIVQPIYERWVNYNPKLNNYLQDFASYKGLARFTQLPPQLKFEGNIMNAQDRYNHGMFKVVPFYDMLRKAQRPQ